MISCEKLGKKLLLPIDTTIAAGFPDPIDAEIEVKVVDSDKIPADMEGLDIGTKTQELFADAVKSAKTVVWNGPMGVFENPTLAKGTIAVAKALAETDATTIIGGGDSAVEEAGYLTQFAKSVTIIHRRDELRAQKILQDRAFANEKINFIWDSVVKEIKGNDIKVSGVVVENVKTGEISEHEFGGIFIYVGVDPVSKMIEGLGITDEAGWVITDDHMKTAIPGIFAIGDVRKKELRQITTAVGDGAIAGQGVYQYIENMK